MIVPDELERWMLGRATVAACRLVGQWRRARLRDVPPSCQDRPMHVSGHTNLHSDMRNPVHVLPDVVLSCIWDNLGPGRYRFIAGVHSSFRDSYTDFLQGSNPPSVDAVKFPCTHPSCIVESVKCTRLYLNDLCGKLPSQCQRRKLMPERSMGCLATWITGQNDSLWDDILYLAALYGNLQVLDMALENIPYAFHWWAKHSNQDACRMAALGGEVAALEVLRKNDFHWDTRVCQAAAKMGHLEVLQWAHANECPWDKWTCAEAAGHGQLEVLQWAREHHCPWDENTIYAAARHGNFAELQFARTNGCPWDTASMMMAAESGNLEIVKWMREMGCRWNTWVCAAAASKGHMHILKWLRSQGCPWDEWTSRLNVYIVSADGYFIERLVVPTMAQLKQRIGIALKTMDYEL